MKRDDSKMEMRLIEGEGTSFETKYWDVKGLTYHVILCSLVKCNIYLINKLAA